MEIETASGDSRKAALARIVLDLVYPVGVQYHQVATVDDDDPDLAMPAAEAPAALFGGTWEKLYDTEGIDFHTEGYDGTAHGAGSNRSAAGVQNDEAQGHWHRTHTTTATTFADPGGSSFSGIVQTALIAAGTQGSGAKNPYDDGVNGTPRVGARTTDRNRWVRIWRRTG